MTSLKKAYSSAIIILATSLMVSSIVNIRISIINIRSRREAAANLQIAKEQITNLQMQVKTCMAIAKDRVAGLQAELKACKLATKPARVSRSKPAGRPALPAGRPALPAGRPAKIVLARPRTSVAVVVHNYCYLRFG